MYEEVEDRDTFRASENMEVLEELIELLGFCIHQSSTRRHPDLDSKYLYEMHKMATKMLTHATTIFRLMKYSDLEIYLAYRDAYTFDLASIFSLYRIFEETFLRLNYVFFDQVGFKDYDKCNFRFARWNLLSILEAKERDRYETNAVLDNDPETIFVARITNSAYYQQLDTTQQKLALSRKPMSEEKRENLYKIADINPEGANREFSFLSGYVHTDIFSTAYLDPLTLPAEIEETETIKKLSNLVVRIFSILSRAILAYWEIFPELKDYTTAEHLDIVQAFGTARLS